MRAQDKGRAVVDTSTWLTCAEAADLLGRSPNTIRNWERRGRLHPVRVERRNAAGGPGAVLVYDPAELGRLPRRKPDPGQSDPGEIAARAFEMFDEGRSARQVVVALRVPPESADELREWWEAQGGSDVVLTPGAHAALEEVVGPFVGLAGLLDAVRSFTDRARDQILVDAVGPFTKQVSTPTATTHGSDKCKRYPECETCGPPRL